MHRPPGSGQGEPGATRHWKGRNDPPKSFSVVLSHRVCGLLQQEEQAEEKEKDTVPDRRGAGMGRRFPQGCWRRVRTGEGCVRLGSGTRPGKDGPEKTSEEEQSRCPLGAGGPSP